MLGKKVNILLTLLTLLSATSFADTHTQYSATVCDGSSYLFGCRPISPTQGSGTYTDEDDATKHLKLTFGTPKSVQFNDSIKSDELYIFGCQILGPGNMSATETLTQSSCECDSTVRVYLTMETPAPVLTEVKVAYTDSIKSGEIYLFDCKQYDAAGTYSDTIHLSATKDSITFLTLSLETPAPVLTEVKVAYADSIKSGEIYLFGCKQYDAAGTYSDTIHLSATKDSITFLTLSLETPAPEEVKVAYTDSIIDGEIYLFGCKQFTTDTTYADTIYLTGKDSITVLTLKVKPACPATPVVGDTVAIVCEGDLPFLWHGMSLSSDTTMCDDTLRAVIDNKCDSIVRLKLTVQRVIVDSFATVYACPTEPYNWVVDGHDFGSFTQDTVYRDTLRYAETGCDSARYTLDLKFYQAKDSVEDHMIYFGDSYAWYVNGNKVGDYNTAGTYYDTLRNQAGCDSIRFTLNLTQECNPTVPVTDTVATVCESDLPFLWHGKSLSSDTTMCDDTVKNSYLCDSIVRLALTVQRVKLDSAATVYICPNTSYNWIVDGHDFGTFTEENIYRDTIRYAAGGCDSAHYTLDLKFYQAKDSIENKMIYFGDSYEWYVNGTKVGDYNTAGTYYDTLRNQVGCDSIRFTLNLTQECNPTIPVTDTVATVCESELPFLWHGKSLSSDTTMCDDTVKSILYACDSVIHRLSLTVLHPATGVDAKSNCNSVEFKGITYYESTTVLDTIVGGAANGCDSIVTVTITVLKSDTTVLPAVDSCNRYHLKTADIDTLITTTGDYRFVLQNANGCDSIVKINVTIAIPYLTDLSLIHKFGDRLLMINRNEINAIPGWYLDSLDTDHPEYVSWFEIDPNGNETRLPDGYTYSLPNGEPLPAGYTYYAKVNIPATGGNCGAIGTTERYTIPSAAPAPALVPSLARPGEEIRIVNLDPGTQTVVRIYSADGLMQGYYTVIGQDTYTIKAAGTTGFYMVELTNEALQSTLRYIVK